jgi:hypothetical protein
VSHFETVLLYDLADEAGSGHDAASRDVTVVTVRAPANDTKKGFQAMNAQSGKGPSQFRDPDELNQDKNGIRDPRPAAIFGERETSDTFPVRWGNISTMGNRGQFGITE